MWTEIFKATGDNELDEIEKLPREQLEKIVRFKPPGEEVPGTHGPGTARRVLASKSDDVVYFSQMAERLVEEAIPYFVFEPSQEHASSGKETKPHKKFVKPGIAVGDDEGFWQEFTTREIRFLQEVSTALKHLGPTEIRALGTHKNAEGTCREIKRELKWAREKARVLISDLENGNPKPSDVKRLRSVSHEGYRKAILNEDYYASAYGTMLDRIDDGQLKEAFDKAQQSPTEVWGHSDIPDLRDKVQRTIAVADYLYGIVYFLEHPSDLFSKKGISKAATEAKHSFENSLEHLNKHGLGNLPGSLQDVFERKTGAIKGSVVQQLSALLNDI